MKLTRKQKGILSLALLALIGIVLLVLPGSYFDTGKPMCISVLLFNKQCYGCGMTRGIQHLIHFEFEQAYAYNKLSFVVFPLLVYMILWEIYRKFFK